MTKVQVVGKLEDFLPLARKSAMQRREDVVLIQKGKPVLEISAAGDIREVPSRPLMFKGLGGLKEAA